MTWEDIDEEVETILVAYGEDPYKGAELLRECVYRKLRNGEIAESAQGVAENRRKRIEELEARIEELEARLKCPF